MLDGILSPASLREVRELADHTEPGTALDLVCERLLDANAPLDVAQRGRLPTVGWAMDLNDTVAMLAVAREKQDD